VAEFDEDDPHESPKTYRSSASIVKLMDQPVAIGDIFNIGSESVGAYCSDRQSP